jgi:hypothetical protein
MSVSGNDICGIAGNCAFQYLVVSRIGINHGKDFFGFNDDHTCLVLIGIAAISSSV